MKHFVNIERLREFDEEFKVNNRQKFNVGDHVVIQTKIDGANASVTWGDGQIKCFSRKNELNPSNTLNGWWNVAQQFNPKAFELYPNYLVFGEWLIKHTIQYNADKYRKFYVYDIYNKETETYMLQEKVREWCDRWGFNYIETLYDGGFISWEHVRSFLKASKEYGDTQEGVVIKNQEYLRKDEVEDSRQPSYIKIVNQEFCETKAHSNKPKEIDPNKLVTQDKAEKLMATIVTEPRVRKEILKMIDENLLPEKLEPKDMGTVSKLLPKRIMDDCLKEEKETVIAAGEYVGKVVNVLTMNFARSIILGK